MKILVTGAAGFIGLQTSLRLLAGQHEVVGIDNLNPYYSVQLKKDRLSLLLSNPRFTFYQAFLEDSKNILEIFSKEKFDAVIHLAAQAGVRYSLENPFSYVQSNLVGFMSVLEGCRRESVTHLVYASTSSIYGLNQKIPFSEHDPVNHPVSMYAATKRANELLAHSYSHLYSLPTTGLRFFTVYGPYGRPDMAIYKFTRSIDLGEPIQVYNHGHHHRGFTYVDDVVEGMMRVVFSPARPSTQFNALLPDPCISSAPFRIYNIGHPSSEPLSLYIQTIEKHLGKTAKINYCAQQPGDMESTAADLTELEKTFDYCPKTSLDEGIKRFVNWYRDYYATRT